jgi:plasmid stabilization system protein ParE
LDEFDRLIAYIAADRPKAAARVADRIDAACSGLGAALTGRPGRVSGTYEKVVSGLPYIVVYALDPAHAKDAPVTILRVIHGARDWPPGGWPTD